MIKSRAELRGEHVWIRLWVGPDASHLAAAGDLCMRPDEAAEFLEQLRSGAAAQAWARDTLDCLFCDPAVAPTDRAPGLHLVGQRAEGVNPSADLTCAPKANPFGAHASGTRMFHDTTCPLRARHCSECGVPLSEMEGVLGVFDGECDGCSRAKAQPY